MEWVALYGPTVTIVTITPDWQNYKSGVFSNDEQCANYAREPVPSECLEERDGKKAYTCLGDCSGKMPEHCDFLFKPPSDNRESQAVTVFGYGEEADGRKFWKIKNSWGPDWGEGGYMKLTRGLGHCNIGAYIAQPICQ